MGETWIRAGTAAEPRGAVAFIGNSEHWSHTRYNDTAAIGAYRMIRDQGARRMGQLLNASKAEIMILAMAISLLPRLPPAPTHQTRLC